MLPGMTSLVDRLLPDELWQRIQPLLSPPRPGGGIPRRASDLNYVAALIFMARTSTPGPVACQEVGLWLATTCWQPLGRAGSCRGV